MKININLHLLSHFHTFTLLTFAMLPKNRRIKRKDFGSILKENKYISHHFLVYIKKTKSDIPSTFSFSVSKKVAKKAVDRNKLRRQGYSVVSKNIKNIESGFMCLFSFKKGQYPMSFSVLEKEIYNILLKNKIINL